MSVDYAIRCNGCGHVSSDTEPAAGRYDQLAALRIRLKKLGWTRRVSKKGSRSTDHCPRCAEKAKK